MNELRQFAALFDEVGPWEGQVPSGFFADFLGTLTSSDFLAYGNVYGHQPGRDDGSVLRVAPPKIGDHNINGEIWFEAADWLVAARRARGRFVMVTLGALYGYQAVASCQALRRLNPMPYQLVAVEPIPENVAWIRRHMRDNGIDPDEQWIIQSVISDHNEPVFFFVGAAGLGAQNCIEANEQGARRRYFEHLVKSGRAVGALRSLLKENRIGLRHDIIPGKSAFGDIKLVSSITLGDVLSPLDHVDLLEADLQQSEILVFPPFRELLRKKVSRIHLGTHGDDVHRRLHQMFAEDGWEIVFSYEPDREHDTELGPFRTNDGILTVQNPKF